MLTWTTVWMAVLVGLHTAAAILQAPTADQVSTELASLILTGLGIVSSAGMQFVKRLIAPLDNAAPMVKAGVALAWSFGLTLLASKWPVVAALLPADPTLLGGAVNGILLFAVMTAAHAVKKVLLPPAPGL